VSAVHTKLAAYTFPYELIVAKNHGRDILPFLKVASKLIDEGVEVVLKLHTKRSIHRSDGEIWRREIIQRLLDPPRAQKILEAFSRHQDLGLVGPDGHIQPLKLYWGDNAHNVQYLAARMGIADADINQDKFVSGSMFWVRLAALRPVLDANLNESDFEIEAGQLDGTLPHALERIFGLSVTSCHYRLESAAFICGEVETPDKTYRYAKRT
jgi:lipopolysaccharide biosynthesis protein